ncbi:hypothetical protein Leryth_020107 [Lithospermum erythrorhizon]|nr:hypothetical protein Leryth_020107 [Lithospermum erythrorhizon]
MERYSGGEGSAADSEGEWGETGLEEPMWQMGINTGQESYPERPNDADCIYYLRTGFCGYGARCRFNHPPERVGQPACCGEKECMYYVKTWQCKFGLTCKFHHPQPAGIQAPTVAPEPHALTVPPPTIYQTAQSPSFQSSQILVNIQNQ